MVRPSGPPTDEIPVWTSPDGVDRKTAQAVIDLAMRAGVAMLSTGASTADVSATVLMLTNAYHLRSVHVDLSYTSITVSYHRGPEADPITVMRIVRYRVQDFTRLERLRALIRELSHEPIDVEEARVRFDAVIRAPHPYRRWLVTMSSGGLAAGVTGLIGGGPLIILFSFLTAWAVTRVLDALGKVGVTSFFAQCVGSAIPTVVATLIVIAGANGVQFAQDISPSLIVAAGIVLLLSGMSIVGAAEDALSGYYVTAGARAFEVIVLSLGIVVGITIVLTIGQKLGYPIAISERTILSDNVGIQLVCAAAIALSFAISSYSSGRVVFVATFAAVLGWLILALVERMGFGPATASASAALVIGFAARLGARRVGVSSLAVTTAAIVPLLPGRMAYQGISQIVSQPSGLGLAVGLPTLAGAFGLGLGLAAGVIIGNYFATLILSRLSGESLQRAIGSPVRSDPRLEGRGEARSEPKQLPLLSDSGEVPIVTSDAAADSDSGTRDT